MARVALYVRVSTDKDQTVENQLIWLREWAARSGHEVVAEYNDQGISGAKGRDKRPGLDAMMKDATRRKFQMVAVTSLDRLGRSLPHMVLLCEELRVLRIGIFLRDDAIDTTTPDGELRFAIMASVAQYVRRQIREQTLLGLERARRQGKQLGRPKVSPTTERQVVALLEAKTPLNRIVRQANVGKSTVYRIKEAMNL